MNQSIIKILLIEDNPGDIRLIREMLSGPAAQKARATFEIIYVGRLSQALLALNEAKFEVILADLSLPDSQGLETVSAIVQAASQLPVVVMSDLDDQDLAVEAVKIGAQDYLVKRYANDYSLPRALHYAIERKRGQEALKRSEAFNRGVLSSLTAHIAVLNGQGEITAVNHAWEHFAQENGASGLSRIGPGLNYLEICRQGQGREGRLGQAALTGIQAVLEGAQPIFSLEYPHHAS
jgi:DNA-binding NarL/FixJ family response regulator